MQLTPEELAELTCGKQEAVQALLDGINDLKAKNGVRAALLARGVQPGVQQLAVWMGTHVFARQDACCVARAWSSAQHPHPSTPRTQPQLVVLDVETPLSAVDTPLGEDGNPIEEADDEATEREHETTVDGAETASIRDVASEYGELTLSPGTVNTEIMTKWAGGAARLEELKVYFDQLNIGGHGLVKATQCAPVVGMIVGAWRGRVDRGLWMAGGLWGRGSLSNGGPPAAAALYIPRSSADC